MYGNLVETKFRDVEQTTDQEITELMQSGKAPLPIVRMNGSIRITGHLFVPLLIREIDEILEKQTNETTP